ncbi:hypothetical protein BpHYR1_037432 [Brachionus plicatilis]|uniref:Uncharacterized protein n=1 Tax=Brachionus plicatilis TaxID=10195 RepID=A0A3M7RU00_BRAPC|nr:hypothetical protein BpHYR1_037432 [Brachionus plicatilis]
MRKNIISAFNFKSNLSWTYEKKNLKFIYSGDFITVFNEKLLISCPGSMSLIDANLRSNNSPTLNQSLIVTNTSTQFGDSVTSGSLAMYAFKKIKISQILSSKITQNGILAIGCELEPSYKSATLLSSIT